MPVTGVVEDFAGTSAYMDAAALQELAGTGRTYSAPS